MGRGALEGGIGPGLWGNGVGTPPLIAHFVHRFDVGGLENGVVNLINRIPDELFRHAIVSLTDASNFRKRLRKDIPVVCLHKREGKDLHLYVRIFRALKELQPDIVHTRNLATIEAVIPAALVGVPHRMHGEHGWDIADLDGRNRRYRLLRRLLRPGVHRYIALSQHIEGYLTDRIQVSADRLEQIYNGVDHRRFCAAPGGRAQLPVDGAMPTNGFVIGWVGRMQEVKDPLSLVEAFIALKARSESARRHARLALIGDGPLRVKAERRLREAGLLPHAWLPGMRDDIPELLRGFNLFVLPSKAEGISNTLLEAMATSLPVIATDVGGNPELIVQGQTGYLVPREDPEALAHAMERYLDDPVLSAVHGANARELVEKRFSLERMVAAYVQAYETLIDSRRRQVSPRLERGRLHDGRPRSRAGGREVELQSPPAD